MEMNIEQVARLARIKLHEVEKKKLSGDLEKILGYVKKLDEIDTKNVEATSHVLNLENVFRADEVVPTKIAGEILEQAPQKQGPFFKVPKVIEET